MEETEEGFPSDPRDLRQRGFRSGAAEYIGQVLSLDQHLIRNRPSTFFWRVRGDVTRILGLRNGDLLLVDRSLEPRHDDLAVVVVEKRFRIRRLRRWGDTLIPAPLRRSEKIDPFESWEVWGVIRAVIRDFKHGDRAR